MISADTAFRVFAKYSDWKSTMDSAVAGHFQAPYVTRSVGFRADSNLTSADKLMASGQLTSNIYGEMEPIPQYAPPYTALLPFRYNEGSAFINSKWSHVESETSDYAFRLSYAYEHAGRGGDTGWTNSLETEFQDHFEPFDSHDVVWGLAYKLNNVHIGSGFSISTARTDVKQNVFSGFARDDISLIPSQLHATIGTKVEYNNFSGFDFEPSARLIWTPNDNNSLWAAVSRAARTPTMAEQYSVYFQSVMANPANPALLPIAIVVTGNQKFKSEKVMVYELGYRVEPLDNVSLDLTAFYNDSTGLRSAEYTVQSVALTPIPHVIQNMIMGNFASARSYGWELAGEWQPVQGWRLRGTYAFWNGNAVQDGFDKAITNLSVLGQVPHNQFTIRSSADLPGNLETDITIRYVGALSYTPIKAYATVDARLGWKPTAWFDLSLVGKNLIGPPHTEFDAPADNLKSVAARMGREVFVKASVTF
jgi:iron complex outermembrane receptor protein